MSDLLPCPFCGGTDFENKGIDGYDVLCGTCGAFGPEYSLNKAAWNTRADNTVIKELAEALVGLRGLAFESVELDSWPEMQKSLHETGKALTKHADRIQQAKEQGNE